MQLNDPHTKSDSSSSEQRVLHIEEMDEEAVEIASESSTPYSYYFLLKLDLRLISIIRI